MKRNKMRIAGVIVIMFVLFGCNGNREKMLNLLNDTTTKLIQVKRVNGYAFMLRYMPQIRQVAGDQEEWCFRLNIHSSGETLKGEEGLQASYGVDTLFQLISGKDTLAPLHAMRVANGNLKGIEYMIIFEKPVDPGGMFTKFCFSDWLFTHQFLEFPLRAPAIIKIDSLSSQI